MANFEKTLPKPIMTFGQSGSNIFSIQFCPFRLRSAENVWKHVCFFDRRIRCHYAEPGYVVPKRCPLKGGEIIIALLEDDENIHN
jgi:hypothetical protein